MVAAVVVKAAADQGAEGWAGEAMVEAKEARTPAATVEEATVEAEAWVVLGWAAASVAEAAAAAAVGSAEGRAAAEGGWGSAAAGCCSPSLVLPKLGQIPGTRASRRRWPCATHWRPSESLCPTAPPE